MTATAVGRRSRRDWGGGTGTITLVRFFLRRDRVRLGLWVGGIGLMVAYVCVAIPAAYREGDLDSLAATFNEPAGRLMIGPGYGFDQPTYESFIANGYGLYLMLLAALMSIFSVTRYTRAEEQSGRAELVLADVVGRRAPLAAAVAVVLVANGAVALAVALAMVGIGGAPVTGSVLLGAATGAVGLAFAGITTIAVQLSSYSRAASGLAGLVLGAAFLARGAGDMAREGGNALSWASPLGWAQQTAPFAQDRWWPLVLLLAVAVITPAVGFILSARRDLGASFLAVRPGPPRAPRWLGTPVGLAFRLQRASIIGWTAALAVTGFVYGAFAQSMGDIEGLPAAFSDVFGDDDLIGGYLAFIATFSAILMGAFVITAVIGVRTDETGGRGEPVLATPVGRLHWLGGNLLVTLGATLGMAGVVGVAAGAGAAIVTGEAGYVLDVVAAQYNLVPAVAVVLGVAVLVFGVAPRALAAAWVVVAFGFLADTFGQVLGLPRVVLGLSPFEHPAAIPVDGFSLTPVLVLSAVAAALVAVGCASYRHRDIDGN